MCPWLAALWFAHGFMMYMWQREFEHLHRAAPTGMERATWYHEAINNGITFGFWSLLVRRYKLKSVQNRVESAWFQGLRKPQD